MAATDVERLVLQMSADMTRLNRNVVAGQRAFDRQLLAMERRAQAADRRLTQTMARAGQNMTSALKNSLTSLAPTLAAAFSAQQVIKYADAYTGLQNRLKTAGLEGERLITVENALYGAANKNGVAIDAVSQLYQRASLAKQSLGASDEQLIAMTEGVTAALTVQGISATQASGPLLQLGQALGGGTVRAEELNSLLEGTPIILQAAANGSKKFNGDMNALSAAIRDGKVSSQEFFQSLLVGLPAIQKQAESMPLTVSQAFEVLNNELGRFVGQTDQGLSATARMAAGIQSLAMNLDKIVPVVVTLVGLIGARFAWSLTVSASAIAANGVAAATSAVRLAQFQTAMQMSMTGATRATAQMTMATTAATGAMRSFGAALAANPIGLALVAITALTAAYNSYKETIDEAQKAAENSNKLIAEFGVLSSSSVTGVNALTGATSALRTETLRLADARLEDARAAAIQQYASNQATIKKLREPSLMQRGLELGLNAMPGGGIASRALSNARESAAQALEKQSTDLMAGAIQLGLSPTARWTSDANRRTAAASGDPKKKGSTGPTEAELQAAREMLALQAQLQLLQAQGREDEARTVQRKIDLINLTKQYVEAQVAGAADAAQTQITAVSTAEDAARGFAILWEKNQKAIEDLEEDNKRHNALLLDRLGYEAELARLSGDPARIEVAERELYIAERINALLALRPDLTAEAAKAQAGREFDALGSAGREGEARDRYESMKDEFRRSFADGIRAALDGDMAGFFESLADRFTDRMLDNLADDLFDLLASASKGMASGGGGGWMAAIASAFAPRATGGPVTAGQSYLVGERRPEVFVPNVNGTVIPSVNAAMGRMDQASAARHQQAVAVRIDVNDDRFNAYVDGRAAPIAIQSTAAGVAHSQDQMRTAQRRGRQSLV